MASPSKVGACPFLAKPEDLVSPADQVNARSD